MWNGYGVCSNPASTGEPPLLHMTTLTTGSVLKYGGQGQSGQAIKLFQAPQKISFTFHFALEFSCRCATSIYIYLLTYLLTSNTKSFVLDDVKLQSYYNNSF